MLPAFILCMAVQVYSFSRNQSPTTPEAVPAEKTAPPAAPAETPAPPPAPAKEPAPEPKAPLQPEEPGPGDFLDEFAKRYVGYTVKEIQTSSDRELLNKEGTPELSELKAKMVECQREHIHKHNVRSKTKYEVLYQMKAYLKMLMIRLYPRATVLEMMLEYWSKVDSDIQQDLHADFSAFVFFPLDVNI